MRKPHREIPQRRLIDELRVLIDGICHDEHCGHATCAASVERLRVIAQANPHNFWSTKVTYNLGTRRCARVDRMVNPSPHARVADSLR